MNELQEHNSFEPEKTNRFLVNFLDENGNKIFPSSIISGIYDERYNLKIKAFLTTDVGDYDKILNKDSTDRINLYWLDAQAKKTYSVQYKNVRLSNWTFGELDFDSKEKPVSLTLNYSFATKEIDNEQSRR